MPGPGRLALLRPKARIWKKQSMRIQNQNQKILGPRPFGQAREGCVGKSSRRLKNRAVRVSRIRRSVGGWTGNILRNAVGRPKKKSRARHANGKTGVGVYQAVPSGNTYIQAITRTTRWLPLLLFASLASRVCDAVFPILQRLGLLGCVGVEFLGRKVRKGTRDQGKWTDGKAREGVREYCGGRSFPGIHPGTGVANPFSWGGRAC